ATLELALDPLSTRCDGVDAATLTAEMLDSRGKRVADGTDVFFEVQYGFADPVTSQSNKGEASTQIRLYPEAAQFPGQAEVVAHAGDLRSSIGIGCSEESGCVE